MLSRDRVNRKRPPMCSGLWRFRTFYWLPVKRSVVDLAKESRLRLLESIVNESTPPDRRSPRAVQPRGSRNVLPLKRGDLRSTNGGSVRRPATTDPTPRSYRIHSPGTQHATTDTNRTARRPVSRHQSRCRTARSSNNRRLSSPGSGISELCSRERKGGTSIAKPARRELCPP